jgi:tetratricopeptide (TPR) repeat protein
MLSKLKPCFGRNLLLVSLFVLLLPRFAFPLETGEKYVVQAARFLAEGYDLQAILSYRQAIGSGLRDPSVMRDMALAYYRLGMLEEAIENMEVGVKISPRDPNMLTELGVLYGARGDNTKAISILKESLQLDPGQGDVYINLGLALFRQGDLKLAWQAARIAEKLHQNPILLVEKLQKSAEQEPGHYPFQDTGPVIALRQIVLDSEKQGEELIALWQQGASLAPKGKPLADILAH